MLDRLLHRHLSGAPPKFAPYFRVNDAVRLEIGGSLYGSRVEETREDSLWVAWPAVLGVVVPVQDDQPVVLISGYTRGMQGFLCRVADRSSGSPCMLKVCPMRALGQVQQRDFVRVPDSRPVTFTVLASRSHLPGHAVETWTRDISGGGLCLYVRDGQELHVTDRLSVEFSLPDDGRITATAEVIWVGAMPKDVQIRQIAIQFTDIRDEDRRRIVRRVFARQAQLRKAGLL